MLKMAARSKTAEEPRSTAKYVPVREEMGGRSGGHPAAQKEKINS
jgi:hypothetical protein